MRLKSLLFIAITINIMSAEVNRLQLCTMLLALKISLACMIKLHKLSGHDVLSKIVSTYSDLLSTEDIINISPEIICDISGSDLETLKISVPELLKHEINHKFTLNLHPPLSYENHKYKCFILDKTIEVANIHEFIRGRDRRYKETDTN